MRFLFENIDSKEITGFHDWKEYSEGTGTHWKTVQLKNNNGHTVKCRLGKGKIWRAVFFCDLGVKVHCKMCKKKAIDL